MAWTEERKELVRRRWVEGYSASQIAAEVGAVSRSAVIGVIRREGWQRGGTRVTVWTAARLAQLKQLDIAGYRIPQAANKMGLSERQIYDGFEKLHRQLSQRRIRIPRPRTPRIVPLIPLDASIPRANLPPPDARPATFPDLAPGQCKWPLGNYDDPPEFFCGAAAAPSVPYCSYHQSVSCYGSGAVLPEPERATRRVGSLIFTRRVA